MISRSNTLFITIKTSITHPAMPPKTLAIISYPSFHPTTNDPLTFNMSYYTSTHMPLIERTWGPHGLRSWSMVQFPNPCPVTGKPPPYLVQVTCHFDSLKDLQTALKLGGEETKNDVERFSNIWPEFWVGHEEDRE
ncbi:hypothetical protein B0J11DRAFT_539294 [Dendryphion nanum]|uniref:EthD domain-containing protein n=1 Tax=Dendryphion nanum TaxID=256645 RepID=A0A9P9DBW5_9PLEO|nr:hypothetical protein B0J11DRAFT_539294 [Dendryphion nanum]